MRCDRCGGLGVYHGSDAEMALAIGHCVACMNPNAAKACGRHACHICDGSGAVCPACRGARFVRRDVPYGHPDFGQALRCETCCEGNQVSQTKERRAIERYLVGYVPDTRTPAERDAERKASAAASYARYVSIHGDPRRPHARTAAALASSAEIPALSPEELLRLGDATPKERRPRRQPPQ